MEPVEASTAPAPLEGTATGLTEGAHDDEATVEIDEKDEMDVGNELASAVRSLTESARNQKRSSGQATHSSPKTTSRSRDC